MDNSRKHLDVAHPFGLLRAWRWWLPVAALVCGLALVFVDPFAGDWDALDYTVLALEGRPSSMLLGRMLFIFFNHLLWRLAQAFVELPREQAYLLFKYVVVVQSPIAVVACWALAKELTRSAEAATIAALLVGLSPFFIIYSGQAMTEIPAIFLLATALVVHLRGLQQRRRFLVLAGAALLGLSANMREASLLYAPWLVFMPLASGWRWRGVEGKTTALAAAIFLLCAFGPFALLFALDLGDYRAWWLEWFRAAQAESARHPISIGNLRALLAYFFIAAPVVLVVLPCALARAWRRGFSPLLVAALIGLVANLALVAHYSLVLNGRYLLTGLPALAPLVGDYLWRCWRDKAQDERRAFARAAALVSLVTAAIGLAVYAYTWPTLAAHALTGEYKKRLALLPSDAVVMAGGQTVSVNFWRGVGLGEWETIGTGGGWPGPHLPELIAQRLSEGKRVFLDVDPRLWATRGWQEEETRALVGLQERFRFRRVSETIFEIRPPDDASARDDPELWRLLPENRSERRRARFERVRKLLGL